MTWILRDLPPTSQEELIFLRNEPVRLKAYQIVVWVSITARETTEPSGAAPFPAILDTGNSHNFSLHEQHLARWSTLRPDALPAVGAVRDRGQRLTRRAASLWLYRNRSGIREPQTDVPPHRL